MIAADKHILVTMFLNGKSLSFLNGRSLSFIFHIQGASELNVVFLFIQVYLISTADAGLKNPQRNYDQNLVFHFSIPNNYR